MFKSFDAFQTLQPNSPIFCLGQFERKFQVLAGTLWHPEMTFESLEGLKVSARALIGHVDGIGP